MIRHARAKMMTQQEIIYFKGDLTRDDWNNEEACKLLVLLKRRNGLMDDNEYEMKESEWRKVARRAKK